VIDALACGIPVVATKAGGIPEIIQAGKNGFLAPIKNAPLLAEKVTYLLANPSVKKNFIKNGHLTAAQFSKEETARKTLAIYQEIIQPASTQ